MGGLIVTRLNLLKGLETVGNLLVVLVLIPLAFVMVAAFFAVIVWTLWCFIISPAFGVLPLDYFQAFAVAASWLVIKVTLNSLAGILAKL